MNEKMSKIILIVMIAILLLLVGFGAAVGIYLTNSSSTKKAEKETPAHITSTVAVSAGDAITCNIIADGTDSSTKLVRLSVTLYIEENEEFKALLTERQAEVRSEIEKIVKSKTSKQLNELNAEDVLGNEIKKRLNKLYNTNKIVKVACYDLITQ